MLLGYLILFLSRGNILNSKQLLLIRTMHALFVRVDKQAHFTYQHNIILLYRCLLKPLEVNADSALGEQVGMGTWKKQAILIDGS